MTVSGWITSLRLRALKLVPLSEVTIYAFSSATRARFGEPVVAPLEGKKIPLSPCTLVVTVRDEEASIGTLLGSVRAQTAVPEEIILVDGGSTDNTVEIANRWWEEWRAEEPERAANTSFRIIESPPLNIAAGRNRGAKAASHEILLFTDAGCILDPRWSERIRAPFHFQNALQLSMGFYSPIIESACARSFVHYLLPRIETVDPPSFLPSARSVAVHRSSFDRIGGFPEHLTLAGEDTLFDIYLKSAILRVAFVPDAIVKWKTPTGLLRLMRTTFRYAQGDAEAGSQYKYYLDLLSVWWGIVIELFAAYVLAGIGSKLAHPASTVLGWIAVFLVGTAILRWVGLIARYKPFHNATSVRERLERLICVISLTSSQAAGFARGLLLRSKVEQRRIGETRGHLVLIVSHAISREEVEQSAWLHPLLADNWYVVLIHSGAPPIHLFQHPHLEHQYQSTFDPALWWGKHGRFLTGDRELRMENRVGDASGGYLIARLEDLHKQTRAAELEEHAR